MQNLILPFAFCLANILAFRQILRQWKRAHASAIVGFIVVAGAAALLMHFMPEPFDNDDAGALPTLFASFSMPLDVSNALLHQSTALAVKFPATTSGDRTDWTDFPRPRLVNILQNADDHAASATVSAIAARDEFDTGTGATAPNLIAAGHSNTTPAVAAWRSLAIELACSAVLTIMISAGLVIYLAAQLRRREELVRTLSTRETKLRSLLASMPDAVTVIDRSLRIEYANPAAERLYGYGVGEMSGISVGLFMGEATRCGDEQSIRDGFNHVEPAIDVRPIERQARRRDGTELPVEINRCPYESANGPVMVCVIRDLTERKTKDLSLRRSRENLARAQQIARIGSFSRNLLTGEAEWSEECSRILGISGDPAQISLESLVSLLHPDDREKVAQSRDKVLCGESVPPVEFRITPPNGVERILYAEYQADFDDKHKPVRLFGTIQDITERKEIQLALRHSREDLARAQQIARIGSFSRDLVTNGVECSDEFRNIWGITARDELTAERMARLVHPDDRSEFLRGREEALKPGSRMPFDFRITRPDGEQRILHREYGVIFDENERPLRIFGAVQDVTERKNRENEIRRSREALARAQRIAGVGSFEHDSLTGEITFSEEFYRIHGVVPGTAQSTPEFLRSLVHPDDRTKVDEFRRIAAMETPSAPVDYRIIRPDGVERYLHREYEIQYGRNGRPARLFGTIQDITERKSSELKLRESRENLARAQRVASIGSFERDLPTNKVEWSAELCRIFGVKEGTSAPDPEQMIKFVHPDDRDRFIAARASELKGEQSAAFEYRIIRPDGTERIVRRESAVVRDSENRIVSRYGTVQDITDLRIAERRKRELETQLLHSQKLEALGTLAGGIAHDLNNTLVPVLALSKLALRQVPKEGRLHKSLQMIYAAGEQARDLVKRVLAFSRKDDSEWCMIDMAAAVNETLELLRATIPSSITLESRIREVGPVFGAPTQIAQSVTNLVTNASQALGSEIGTITVGLDAVRGPAGRPEIWLSVSDTGMGMDEATRRRIFEPFFTTKAVGEGTGLGLSIVHGIVASHGGRVEVKSEPGKGTRFDIYFPIVNAGEVASSRPAA